MFVFINTFRQASHINDLSVRLEHTVMVAGKATFFTSFTTAAAFAANIASSVSFEYGHYPVSVEFWYDLCWSVMCSEEMRFVALGSIYYYITHGKYSEMSI